MILKNVGRVNYEVEMLEEAEAVSCQYAQTMAGTGVSLPEHSH